MRTMGAAGLIRNRGTDRTVSPIRHCCSILIRVERVLRSCMACLPCGLRQDWSTAVSRLAGTSLWQRKIDFYALLTLRADCASTSWDRCKYYPANRQLISLRERPEPSLLFFPRGQE